MTLGQRISRLRKERGLTLQQVSKGAGLTPSFLSRLERDKVNISVANLRKIARFFGVDMTYFFEVREDMEPVRVVKVGEGTVTEAPFGVIQTLLPSGGSRRINVRKVVIRPGQQVTETFNHLGEEVAYVLSGEVVYVTDDRETVLGAGDLAYYRTTSPHRWENRGSTEATLLLVSASLPGDLTA